MIRIDCEFEAIDRIAILKDIISYILFTHNQIPQPLDLLECNIVENIVIDSTVSNPRERRERVRKARVAAKDMRKLDKLKESIQALLCALQAAFLELPHLPSVLLVLGSSPKQPFAAYEVQFLRISPLFSLSGLHDSQGLGRHFKSEIFTRSLSKKITRALVSQDKGLLFTGPMKLFLFVKAYATSCVPQDFVPKRGYTLPIRKAHPTIIQLMCASALEREGDVATSGMSGCITAKDDDIIWFQYKSNIKGRPVP